VQRAGVVTLHHETPRAVRRHGLRARRRLRGRLEVAALPVLAKVGVGHQTPI
jgi:hypothetical protein